MGTSNWQNIPYCIDLLMKIAPERVLDVGVGFGRWGMILREFCDVWYGRVHRPDWKIRIEGIEGFEKNISAYHHDLYDRIHIGDATGLIETLPGPWSLVMFGDVLEHFTKDTATRLLNTCLDRSDYVVVNIPLGEDWEQGEAYGNVYERHLSSWAPEEFDAFSCVRRALFVDYIGRPFGSFCLSRTDPKDVKGSLFSPVAAHAAAWPPAAAAEEEALLKRVRETAQELEYIKSHSTYRLAARLRETGWWNRLRWVQNRNRRVATVRSMGMRGPGAQDSEVWLVEARPNTGEAAVPWDFVEREGAWEVREAADRAYGRCLMTPGGGATGRLRVPVDSDPELLFVSHPWSGSVEVQFGGRREVIDLYSPQGHTVTVRPARTPMRQPDAAPPLPQAAPLNAPAAPAAAPVATSAKTGLRLFSAREEQFIEAMRAAGARVVAVSCPRWLGVTNSTRGLFEHWYPMPATREEDPFNISPEMIEHHAAVIAATGVNHVVVSGGDEAQLRLIEAIARLRPGCRFDLFWHGSYVQFAEDHTFAIFKMWVEAARRETIYSIATAKHGQDRFLNSLGVRSAVLLNRVDGEPKSPPTDLPEGERHIGMWLSGHTFRKNPHATLSALAMVPGVRLHATGVDPRSREVIELLRIPTARLQDTPIPHDELFPAMRRTHCTMYVTFSECCPMLPLESLNMGVPCLVGPVSHLFEDNEFLFERLVVPFPERAEVIAEHLVRAIDERGAIIDEYRRYRPVYEARCRASVEAFLDLPEAIPPVEHAAPARKRVEVALNGRAARVTS